MGWKRLLLFWWPLGLIFLVLSVTYTPTPVLDNLFPDKEEVQASLLDAAVEVKSSLEVPRTLLSSSSSPSPSYNFGRWKAPIEDPQLHELTWAQKRFQKKEWHFLAVSNGRHLFGVAVAQLNYIATAFIYFFDGESGEVEQRSQEFPLGIGTTFAPSSTRGCSSWSSPIPFPPFSLSISLCASESGNRWRIEANGFFNSRHQFHLEATVGDENDNRESLALVYPIGPNRPAYTHKASGLIAEVQQLNFSSFSGEPRPSFFPTSSHPFTGLLDWTRSMHRRVTIWYWVALTWTTSTGQRVGVNLSYGVYPHSNPSKHSDLENIIWIDDKLHVLSSRLIVQGQPGTEEVKIGKTWSCHTEDETLQLHFVPKGLSFSGANAVLFEGSLLHTFGLYNGWIKIEGEKYEIQNIVGILEDHYARW